MVAADDTFRCEVCGNVYQKALSDDEAIEEARRLRPREVNLTQGVVCDDCHQAYLKWYASLSPEEIEKMHREAEVEELLI